MEQQKTTPAPAPEEHRCQLCNTPLYPDEQDKGKGLCRPCTREQYT